MANSVVRLRMLETATLEALAFVITTGNVAVFPMRTSGNDRVEGFAERATL